jgi:predicted Fe-Mo cluster-binding NifX family protein
VEDDTVSIIKNDAANKPGHEGPLELLNGKHVTSVLCAGIGPGALDYADEVGMTVCFGRAKTVGEMITMYNERSLEDVADGSPCGKD